MIDSSDIGFADAFDALVNGRRESGRRGLAAHEVRAVADDAQQVVELLTGVHIGRGLAKRVAEQGHAAKAVAGQLFVHGVHRC